MDCWSRFYAFNNPFKSLVFKVIAGGAILVLLISLGFSYILISISTDNVAPVGKGVKTWFLAKKYG